MTPATGTPMGPPAAGAPRVSLDKSERVVVFYRLQGLASDDMK